MSVTDNITIKPESLKGAVVENISIDYEERIERIMLRLPDGRVVSVTGDGGDEWNDWVSWMEVKL